jgi:hypothetical protein
MLEGLHNGSLELHYPYQQRRTSLTFSDFWIGVYRPHYVRSVARKGKPSLPPGLRYGSFGFFAFMGMYAGFLSAGPLCAKRILAVPNSRIADDLRSVIGDWQAREPPDEAAVLEAAPANASEET